MSLFDIIAILMSLTAIFSYLNYRYFKLPATIGVMLIALLVSVGVRARSVGRRRSQVSAPLIGGWRYFFGSRICDPRFSIWLRTISAMAARIHGRSTSTRTLSSMT